MSTRSFPVVGFASAYPGSMFEREDGGYVRRDDAGSLAGAMLALIASGDRAAQEAFEALEAANNDCDQMRRALLAVAARARHVPRVYEAHEYDAQLKEISEMAERAAGVES